MLFTDDDIQCLMNLRVTDPRDDKARIEQTKGGLLRDSFKWVLDHADFQQWHNSWQGQLLWIKGDPGKGKTTMLCGLIDELDASTTSAALSFFFCQATDLRINNAASQQPNLIRHIQESYRDTGKQLFEHVNAWPALSRIFLNMIEDPRLEKCYLCLLELIVKNRNRYDIKEANEPAKRIITLSLDRSETSEDVRKYLRENANDTFLWVALVCRNLGQVKSWKMFEKLREFPAGLQSFYKMMLDRMLESDDEEIIIRKKIRSVMMVARRPVTLRELPSLVEILSGFSEHDGWLEIVIKLYSSFLTTRQGTVYFVHQSAKDYLRANAPAGIFSPNPDIHYGIYSQRHFLSKVDLRRLKDIRYSCAYWVEHLSEASRAQLQHQNDLNSGGAVQQFFEKHFLYWLEALGFARQVSDGVVAMTMLETLLEADSHLLSLVQDARRFILHNPLLIEDTPLQVYASALLFSPNNSLTRISFKKEEPEWITKVPTVEDEWSASLQSLKGHHDWVRAVAVSYDNTWLASASSDRSIKIWNAATDKCEMTLKGNSNCVNSVVFSHCGKRVVITTGKCIQTLNGHNNGVSSVVFSHDGRYLASTSGSQTVMVWYMTTPITPMWTLIGGGEAKSVVFSPGSRYITSASSDRTVRIWDVALGKCLHEFNGHNDLVNLATFSRDNRSSPDGRYLASSSADRNIKIWDVVNSTCFKTVDAGVPIKNISFNSTSSYIVTDIGHIMLDANQGGIWYCYGFSPDLSWITCHGQGALRLPYELQPVCSAVFGSTVVVGYDCGRIIFVWDMSYIHVANGAKGQWQAPTSKNRLVSPTQPITIRITGSTAYELPMERFDGRETRGLKPAKTAPYVRTPLHLAVLHDDDPAVLQLLKEGSVDEDARDKYSRTALFYAMKKAKREIALALPRKWNVPDRVVIDNLENPTDEDGKISL
ncbi:hypothetical protein V8C34DRAFT_326479 [Trichoderma compactum]